VAGTQLTLKAVQVSQLNLMILQHLRLLVGPVLQRQRLVLQVVRATSGG